MITLLCVRVRNARLAWPATLLILLLQRTPVLRVVAEAEFASGGRAGQLLRAIIPAVVALGAAHTLTGQTHWQTNPAPPVQGTVGAALQVGFALTGGLATPESYAIVGNLPPGLTVGGASGAAGNLTLNSSTGFISGTPTTAGDFSVMLTAYDGPNRTASTYGNSDVFNLTFHIVAGAAPPGFTTHPQTQTVNAGANVTFTVVVTGTPAPTLKWRRDTVELAGQTGASLVLNNVTVADAGSYDCVATNSSGSITSNAATLTVNASPAFTVQPAPQTVRVGGSASFSAAAEGSGTVTYQWRKDNADIAGATSSSVNISSVQAGDAGAYTVVATNSLSATTSSAAQLTVVAPARYFFGTFGGAANGSFVLVVRLDNSGSFAAALAGGGSISNDSFAITGGGAFVFDAGGTVGTVSGLISAHAVAGTVSGNGLAFTGAEDAAAGSTAAIAGRYEGALVDTSDGAATVFAGSDGNAFVLVRQHGVATGAAASLAANGAIHATLLDGRTIDLSISGAGTRIAGSLTATGQTPREIAGGWEHAILRRDLFAISMRAQSLTGDNIMIAGIVVGGSGSKRVLIRGIGPGISTVTGFMTDPQMLLFRFNSSGGSDQIGANDNWGVSADATAIDDAAVAIGLGRLGAGSRDAAVLADFSAGAYTAHVFGVNNATGVALVEIYDVDEGGGAGAQLVGISMRGLVGTGNDIMIPGFLVAGDAPKRVLIRAIGPDLTVGGKLLNPQMTVQHILSNSAPDIAANDDWELGGDRDAVFEATARVGLGQLGAGSRSAAIVLWLSPGVYTAHVSGVGDTTGVALVELYAVP